MQLIQLIQQTKSVTPAHHLCFHGHYYVVSQYQLGGEERFVDFFFLLFFLLLFFIFFFLFCAFIIFVTVHSSVILLLLGPNSINSFHKSN